MVCLGFEPGDGRRRRNHGAIAATPPITFVYCFGLQNLRHHMCCRAIKIKWYWGPTRLAVSISFEQKPTICGQSYKRSTI